MGELYLSNGKKGSLGTLKKKRLKRALSFSEGKVQASNNFWNIQNSYEIK
jgi:hypothetical protein